MLCEYLDCRVKVGTGSADKTTGVTKTDRLCIARAALAGNFITLGSFHDLVHINQSIDEEHSGEGVGVIACHSNDTAALGTLHLLVPLLLQ